MSSAALATVLNLWGQQGHQNLLDITGTSMWPFLREGDRVYVQHGNGTIRWGDVILFRQHERLIVHRLVFSRRQGPTTQHLMLGDNRLYPDAPVGREEVVGRVTAIHRGEMIIDLTRGHWLLSSRIIALLGFVWLAWLSLRRRLHRLLPAAYLRYPLRVIHCIAARVFSFARRLLLSVLCTR